MTIIRDMLVKELQEGAKLSEEYLGKIKGAKTRIKKLFYQKKIKANNEKNLKVIESIQRIDRSSNEHSSANIN